MKKLPKTISEEEFIGGMKQVKRLDLKVAFMLGFYQCMRISEVVSLQPCQVDKDRGFLHIKEAKGGKDRDIPIMPPVSAGLRHLPIRIGIRALQKQFKHFFPDHHFHTLRHSGATHYLNVKKVDVRYIQQLLGHSRLDTTMIYTHVNPTNLQDTFNEVWQ